MSFKDDGLEAWMKSIGDGLIAAQGIAFANRTILREVVGELARLQPDQRKYLAGMFERISARMDRAPLEMEKKDAVAFEREMLAKFFSNVEKDITKPPPARGG